MNLSEIFTALARDLNSSLIPSVIDVLITISPVALAVILYLLAWNLWVDYVRSSNFLKTKYAVLELKLPRDSFKSPLAMETVLHSLHNTSDGSMFAQYWEGKTRPWFSLELISIEGQVKFLIWTEDARKSAVMNALYSQIPGIEVYEREDYAQSVQFDPKLHRIWAAEMIKGNEEPYPIKTYIDYGLDKDAKEEYKIDPMSHMIEFLGSVKPNQQVWIQIVIRAHKKEQIMPGHFFKKHDAWKDKAQDEVNKLLMRDPKTKVAGTKDEATGFTKMPSISKGEQNTVEALERSITKLPFDVGIRAMYIASKEGFDGTFGLGGILSSFKQYSSESLNGFKPNGKKLHAQFNGVPWEDYKNMRRTKQAKIALAAYRRRSFFYTPFTSKTSVMNTEELATMYHFPSFTAAGTPTLERVPSKKSTAPANLPI
ncbi:MAG: hypothetical protein WCV79_03745 [Candidatus Paceibacterota bacterium]|jgi:hypothetical protein